MTALCAFGLGALLLEACGGRVQTLREVEQETESGGGAASAGRGSGPSSGGTTSGAGATSFGGTTSGAGATSFGGAASGGACSTVKCAALACAPGSSPVFKPGACCAVCTVNCPGACPLIECGAGTRAQTLPGSCCPTCVADGAAACKMGLSAYASQREAILDKYRYGCASASECAVIAPVNLCDSGCSYAAVWYGVADSFESNLSNAADMFCASCPPMPQPPCTPPSMPRCIDGQCLL
jgi:hypothetical protein